VHAENAEVRAAEKERARREAEARAAQEAQARQHAETQLANALALLEQLQKKKDD
jgi:hypothetical protein